MERMEMNENNIEMAFEAQQAAEKFAIENEGKTLPLPPAGFPALESIKADGLQGALVLGYIIGEYEKATRYSKDGATKNSGDDGFLDAVISRFYPERKMPKGWKAEEYKARFIYALVKGNPIMLEAGAKKLGYERALATSPNYIKLCEYM